MSEIRNLRDELGELAQIDADLPFSVIADAWDILHMSGQTTPTLANWTNCVMAAIDAYNANQGTYRHNPMKFTARG